MEIDNLGIIIAKRELLLADGKRVFVLIGRPEKFPDSDDYYCPFQITGIGNEKIKCVGGIDSIQALLLALNMVGIDLYTSSGAKAGYLRWVAGEKGELGFPLPDILSDFIRESQE